MAFAYLFASLIAAGMGLLCYRLVTKVELIFQRNGTNVRMDYHLVNFISKRVKSIDLMPGDRADICPGGRYLRYLIGIKRGDTILEKTFGSQNRNVVKKDVDQINDFLSRSQTNELVIKGDDRGLSILAAIIFWSLSAVWIGLTTREVFRAMAA